MKKKGNKMMPIPRQEIIDNLIPTSFFVCCGAALLFVGTGVQFEEKSKHL